MLSERLIFGIHIDEGCKFLKYIMKNNNIRVRLERMVTNSLCSSWVDTNGVHQAAVWLMPHFMAAAKP